MNNKSMVCKNKNQKITLLLLGLEQVLIRKYIWISNL